MRLGAHVSASDRLDLTIDRAVRIGAECVQFFVSAPQTWVFGTVNERVAADFKSKAKAAGIGPNFLHGVYLINLGTLNPDLLRKSVQSLVNYMDAAGDLGVKGVIFHVGSHKGRGFGAVLRQVVESIGRVLDNSPAETLLIVENAAGMGNSIGASFAEVGAIIEAVDSPRLRVCLDTQHCFAAGYDLRTAAGVAQTLEEMDREVGLEHLVAVHCNDSKSAFGSGLDRHENVGQGEMGPGAFEALLRHPVFRDLPFILEVPGMDGHGADLENLSVLKALRHRYGLPVTQV